jgi:hypothetical protein
MFISLIIYLNLQHFTTYYLNIQVKL